MTRRVAYYLITTDFGGVELYALTLLRHLDRSQFAPVVFLRCTDPRADARLREGFRALGVPVRDVDADGLPVAQDTAAPAARPATAAPVAPRRAPAWKRLIGALTPEAAKLGWYYWRRARTLAAALRAERIDVIHFLHTYYPTLEIPLLASRLAGIPVRLSDVQTEPKDLAGRAGSRRLIAWLAAHCATQVRVMSRQMADGLAARYGVPTMRLTVIYSGIETNGFRVANGAAEAKRKLGLPASVRTVVAVGRLSPEKGHRVLIEAAEIVRRRQDIRYLLVGDGSLRGSLSGLVAERRLEEHVRFLGFRNDIPEILSASDLLVLPSLSEGLPWVLLEAMAAGKPVIASDVGGVREVLVEGETGRLVPPGDPQALANVLEELLAAGDEELQRLGEAGRQRVERSFSQRAMLQGVFACYAGRGGTR